MKHVQKSQAIVHENSPSCSVSEYGHITTIDGADAHINGRYPEVGFAVNQISDVALKVLGGYGLLVTKTDSQQLMPGDVAFVSHGEPYYFDGSNLKIFMACTPAWSPDQYVEVE